MTITELTPRAGELRQCLYCTNPLPAANREHVFNSCWGGLHFTTQLICAPCNSAFSQIDHSHRYVTDILMNALRIHGQRQRSVPEIAGTNGITLGTGAQPRMSSATVEARPLPDGSHQVRVGASSRPEARRALQERAEQILGRPLTPDELRHFRALVATATSVQSQTEVRLGVQIDIQANYRSAAHTMMKCLGMFAPDVATSPALHGVKQFARNDVGNWEQFAVRVQPHISPAAQFSTPLGWFNGVELFFSRDARSILGILTILKRVKRAVVLGPHAGPDRIIFAWERIGRSRVEAVAIDFGSEYPPIPFYSTLERPPTRNSIAHEFAQVAQDAVSWDAVTDGFYTELENLLQQSPTITRESVANVRRVLPSLLQPFSHLLRATASPEVIGQWLDAGPLQQLSGTIGRQFIDSLPQDILYRSIVDVISRMEASSTPQP